MHFKSMLLISLILTPAGPVLFAGKPDQSIPVSVEFRDDAVGDRIRSDGVPLYLHQEQGVSAYISISSGVMSFRTCTSSKPNLPCVGRATSLDFGDLAEDILGTAAHPGDTALGLPFTTDVLSTSWVVTPRDENDDVLDGGLLSIMQPGETRLGGLKINFRDPYEELYTIRFSPQNWPDSSRVLITFLGGNLSCQGEGDCASWTVEAVTGAFTDPGNTCCPYNEIQDVGTLVSQNVNDEGDYHLPFKITLTVLPAASGGGKGGGKR